jgi:hypothetical protein
VAKATEATPQLTDNELENLVGLNQKVAFAVRRDAEYAATAVVARGLKDHRRPAISACAPTQPTTARSFRAPLSTTVGNAAPVVPPFLTPKNK